MQAATIETPKNGHAAPPPPTPPKSTPPKFVASQLLPIDSIEPDPENPRKDFPKDEMNELINSVMLFGVRSPIEVRALSPAGAKPVSGVVGLRYRIVFGERRYRAAKAAGLKEIPAIVRNLTDLEAAEIQLDENLKRADLSPLEIAGGYARQLALGRTMEQVCERAGKKRTQVYATLQLLQLGEAGRKALGEEKLSASVAMLVARLPKSLQERAVKQCLGWDSQWSEYREPLNYRDAEEAMAGYMRDLKKAPFDTADAKLCLKAGSCAACPKRTGNAKDLYPDVKSPDVCTDVPCYDEKQHAHFKLEVEKKGLKLLTPEEAPVDELFWNTHGGLRPDAGFVEPGDTYRKDAKARPYTELLPPESLKKLTVVAINHKGQPVELLRDDAKLEKELKAAGKVVTHEQQQKAREKKAAAKAEAGPPPPKLDELTRDVLMGKCVAAVEDKGLLTSPMLKLIACKLLDAMTWEQRLSLRRGLKGDGGVFGLDAKKLDKTFPKLTPGRLAGLVFEAVFDDAFEVCAQPEVELDTMAQDVCEMLGVDIGQVADDVAAEHEAKLAKQNPGDRAAVKAKKADAKAVKKGGKKK